MKQRTYIAIDLKSFYASVECRERGLDPLDTNLVVADESRTDKTICLAVTPSLKIYGISGRGRLFEVKQRVKEANAGRQHLSLIHICWGTRSLLSVVWLFLSLTGGTPHCAKNFTLRFRQTPPVGRSEKARRHSPELQWSPNTNIFDSRYHCLAS